MNEVSNLYLYPQSFFFDFVTDILLLDVLLAAEKAIVYWVFPQVAFLKERILMSFPLSLFHPFFLYGRTICSCILPMTLKNFEHQFLISTLLFSLKNFITFAPIVSLFLAHFK
jgi:hypothetical protein